MNSLKGLLVTATLGVGIAAAQSSSYGVGRTPTAEEIRAWDISISPTGKELPQGHGTAKEGETLFKQKGCAGCHGATGIGGQAPALVKGGPPAGETPPKGMEGMHMVPDTGIMALRSPYATTLWDYISRGMPCGRQESVPSSMGLPAARAATRRAWSALPLALSARPRPAVSAWWLVISV